MAEDGRALAPSEWSVLALLADRPGHGWALAKEMSRSGEVGRVWSVGRPLVYRALDLLQARGLVEPLGSERGARGPNRAVFRATDEGRAALRAWLAEPVDHVHEMRSVFLLKLVLTLRVGMERAPLLQAQRELVAPAVEALQTRLGSAVGSERVFVRFRLEATRAVLEFIDAMIAEENPAPNAAEA